ncbi:MAG: ester cyclase [Firmicutes bacterium]|nr:ester cyclase [Bacillota bacterium]
MPSHKDLYRQYVKALGITDDAARERELDALLASDFVAHDLVAAFPPGGATALKTFRRLVKTAFPDQVMIIEDLIEEDDRVASRQIITGTHLGPYMGIGSTGTQIAIQLLEIVRIRDGRIAERWVSFDRGGLLDTLTSNGRHA